MEEDDEMQSPAPAGSGSPANGRITVTVALPSPPQHSPPMPPAHNNNNSERQLMLALTSQGTAPRSGGGGGREDCWSESATAVLIEAWGERYLELSRGNLKQKHWKEVADIVNASRDDQGGAAKTDIQGKNRIDTVKKKYKLEKSKMLSGGAPSKWPFFSRLDHLIGANNGKGASPSVPPGFAAKNNNNNNQRSIRKVKMPLGAGAQYPPRNTKKRAPAAAAWDSDSSREASPVSADSFPQPAPVFETKRPRTAVLRRGVGAGRGGAGKEIRGVGIGGDKKKKSGGGGGWGDSIRELTQAMLRFGEAYENAETAKLQQVVEMEKQRMKFAKELELQRMQFFMDTQMEFSQLKRCRRNGNTSNHHRGSTANNNSNSN